MSQEDYYEAINTAKEAIRKSPSNKAGYISLGDALNRKGALREAAEAYRKALDIDPTDSEICQKLNSLSYIGQMLSNIEEQAGVIDNDPEDEEALILQDISSLDELELEEGLQLLIAEADRSPYNALSQFVLGTAYYLLDMLDKAKEQFKKAVDIDYGYFYAHLGLGVVCQTMGELDNAIEELVVARDINPENVSVHYNLGTAYMEKLELESAIAEFNESLNIHPGFYNAYLCLGMIYLRLKRRDDAEQALRQYLDIAPESDHAGISKATQFLKVLGGSQGN